jgi:hypothetical protein
MRFTASLRPALNDITAIFGGLLYLAPETPPTEVRVMVERMIESGMLRVYHED